VYQEKVTSESEQQAEEMTRIKEELTGIVATPAAPSLGLNSRKISFF
jgi:hypothetical protein